MDDDPCARVTVEASDGARLVACRYGGNLLGWTPAGGRERLWLSPLARCGSGTAVRGGVPVIFPQFSARGPLPKHGFARDRAWQTLPAEPGGWRARLTHDDETRRIWPHSFTLTLTATAAGDRLDVELAVHNPGGTAFSFMAALHGYLAVGDAAATVQGLGGRSAEDNAAGGAPVSVEPGELIAIQERDLAFRDATDPVILDDAVLGRLTFTAEGFADRVLWNPGRGHTLADVPAGATDFVCVEAAQLAPVTLSPGQTWTGRQTLLA